MEKYFTASELARRYDILPRAISDLFYRRILDDKRCPIIKRVRQIPAGYLPEVEKALRAAGHVLAEPVSA